MTWLDSPIFAAGQSIVIGASPAAAVESKDSLLVSAPQQPQQQPQQQLPPRLALLFEYIGIRPLPSAASSAENPHAKRPQSESRTLELVPRCLASSDVVCTLSLHVLQITSVRLAGLGDGGSFEAARRGSRAHVAQQERANRHRSSRLHRCDCKTLACGCCCCVLTNQSANAGSSSGSSASDSTAHRLADR